MALLAIGMVQLARATADGYDTSTIGAPAYAAIFVKSFAGTGSVRIGTILLLLSALLGAALTLAPRRLGRRAVYAALGALVVTGLIVLVVGAAVMPRHLTFERQELPLHIPGARWIEAGTLLALVAGPLLIRAVVGSRPAAR